MATDELITLEEAAQILGLSYHRTWELCRNRVIREVKRIGGTILVSKASVIEERDRRYFDPRYKTPPPPQVVMR